MNRLKILFGLALLLLLLSNLSYAVDPWEEDDIYHTYRQIEEYLQYTANRNPDLVKRIILGQTYENNNVYALKISGNVNTDDPHKPDILFMGNLHAREWLAVEAPRMLIKYLTENYNNNSAPDHAQVKYLLDNAEIWIVPMANPDGNKYTHIDPDDENYRLWRMNRVRYLSIPIDNDRIDALGVDLNRNFSWKWRLLNEVIIDELGRYILKNDTSASSSDDYGASDRPDHPQQIFRGIASGFELEVQAIENLVKAPSHNFKSFIDFHTFSQFVMWPYGYTYEKPPDNNTLTGLGTKMADIIMGSDRGHVSTINK